jgi:1-acyl-sn-glycerol-3-phosphate acyltransferase
MPKSESSHISESPRIRRDRQTALVSSVLVCLALPTIAVLVSDIPGDAATRRQPLVWLVGAAGLGTVMPLLYWSPYRALGLVPLAALGWLGAVFVGVGTAPPGNWPGWAHGLPLGLIVGALVRERRGAEPPKGDLWLIAAVLVGAAVAWGFVTAGRPSVWAGFFVLAVAAVLTVRTWFQLFRPLFELAVEPVLWVLYHIRGHGPGLTVFPRTGPCLVIANHACWFDPLFLAKILPRPITPMMTARFYDLPVIRKLMVAFGVIRVPEKAIKKETPEIHEAIAALDRGECLVVFPEGYLRRSEDRLLRRFGQGIWQILQARPATPVFACWIEGGWGSYTSYFNGRPTTNKRPDFRRRIQIGVSEAVTIPPEVLAEHLATRIDLMNRVIAARQLIGLPPLPAFELHTELQVRADERGAGEEGV